MAKVLAYVRTYDGVVHKADDWSEPGEEWVVLACRRPMVGGYRRVDPNEDPVSCVLCLLK